MRVSILRACALLAFAMLLPAHAGAQWTQLTSGTNKTLRGVFSASASMTIACGDDGLVLGTTNGGTTWSTANASTTENLNKVFVSGLVLPVITVVGDNGIIRSSSNVGVTWNTHTSGTTEDLNDIFVHDPTNGTTITIVGDNGVILFSYNAGANYGLKFAPTNDRLNGVFFRDLLNGIIVGNSGKILRTTNGGAAWTSITSGVSADLNHVFFTSLNDGWAVGAGGLIMNTTDGGLTWSSVTSPTTFDLHRLSFSDGSNGTAVGERGTIIRTTDGGVTWATQHSGVLTELHSVFFVDANNGMAVGNGGLVLRTTNGGVPVELQSFSAARGADGAVLLRWVTATETGNFGFEVQRRGNGTWQTLGFVAGAGNSTAERRYSWKDSDAQTGMALSYRLRQVDTDGSVEYSPVVEVASSATVSRLTLDAFPQPMRPGGGMLRVGIGTTGYACVRIHDLQGRVVATLFDGAADAGTHVLRWDASALPAGIYVAVAQSGGARMQQTISLVK